MKLRIVNPRKGNSRSALNNLSMIVLLGTKIVLMMLIGIRGGASTLSSQDFSARVDQGLKPLCKEVYSTSLTLSQSKQPKTTATTIPLTPAILMIALKNVLPNSTDVDKFRFNSLNDSLHPTLEFQPESGSFGKKLSVYIDVSVERPLILVSPSERRLILPAEIEPATLPAEIRKLLIGQALHPHSSGELASTTNYLKLKEVQGVALQALQEFLVENSKKHLDSSKRKILFVGPGGVGKTAIYLQALEWTLQQKSPGLHILIADTTGHLNQMHYAVQRLLDSNPQTPTQLIKWGGGAQGTSAHVLSEQTKDMKLRGGSTVLVTTIQSLRQKVIAESDYHELLPLLSSIIYDESHHAGAKMAKNLITQLIDASESKALLIGTTATPIHRESEISDLFGGNTHWFYLDKTIEDERPLSAIIDQLALAIQSGDITPFHRFHFLNRKNLSIPSSEELFVPEDGNQNQRRVLNPKFYPQVFGKIGSLFEKQKKIVLMAGTIAGAERILEFLTLRFPGISTQSLHSDSKDPDLIFDDFKSGKYRILVTVNKFDEALDDPEIDTVIDLSASASPRQLVQRLARPARLAVGKEEVTAVLFLEANEAFIREQITLIEAVLQRRLQGNIRHHDLLPTGSTVDLDKPQIQKNPKSNDFGDEALILASYQEIQATLVEFWNKYQQSIHATTKERTGELIVFIDKRLSERSKRLLPWAKAKNPEEKRLGIWLNGRKAHHPEDWYVGLPQHQIEALKKVDLLKIRIQKSSEDRLAELIAFIDEKLKQGDPSLLPSTSSENENDRRLGWWLATRKVRSQEDWYVGLPKHQIDALEKRGMLKIRSLKKPLDGIAELTGFIEEKLMQGDPRLLPDPLSENKIEGRLGIWLKNWKFRLKENWYVGLPQHQIEALDKLGLLKIRRYKSSKDSSNPD